MHGLQQAYQQPASPFPDLFLHMEPSNSSDPSILPYFPLIFAGSDFQFNATLSPLPPPSLALLQRERDPFQALGPCQSYSTGIWQQCFVSFVFMFRVAFYLG